MDHTESPSTYSPPAFRYGAACLLAAGVLILCLLLDAPPRTFPDNYLIRARLPLWDPELYAGNRPFIIYFYYKLMRYTPGYIVTGQILLSVIAWTFLGLAVASSIRREAPAILVAGLFILAPLSHQIGGWNACLLTEPLAISGFAGFYACLVLWWQKPGRFFSLLLFTASFLLAFTRDQMAYLIPTIALPLAVFALLDRQDRPERSRSALVFFGFTCLIFAVSSSLAQAGKRHQFPLLNVFCQRIIENPDHVDWFRRVGAPVDPLLDGDHDWRGQWASGHEWALYLEPNYQPFRRWVIEKGKSRFALFLLTHPAYTGGLAWEYRSDILSGNLTDYTGEAPSPTRWSQWLWSPFPPWLWAILGVVYTGCALRFGLSPLPLIIGLTVLGNGVLAFHADAMEPPRHCLLTGIALQAACLHSLIELIRQFVHPRSSL
ncbi:MAG: hypothetical protein QNK37_25750 [Acidobacteriota bacterium]|nr:hypothetical protein [Acidobacteriota bacterium]